MNRTKFIMAGALAVFIALLVLGSVHLLKSQAAAREARDRRDAALGNLRTLYAAKPFPSVENAGRMREHVERLELMRAVMTNALSARDVPSVPLSPSRFIQELQAAIRDRLQAKAPIVEGVRAVPDGFAFGFERYLTAGAPMPREQDVPRLAQQLGMIERLVDEVYGAQIGALRRIVRDEFDAGAAPAEADAPRAGGRLRARRDSGAGARPDTAAKSAFYRAQHFTLEVAGRQAAIGDLLNRLAAMPMFVVVTDVDIRKAGDDLRAPQAASPVAAAAAAPGLVAATAGTPGAPAAAEEKISTRPPSQRLVSGVEIDPPVQARIEIEIFNFAKEGV